MAECDICGKHFDNYHCVGFHKLAKHTTLMAEIGKRRTERIRGEIKTFSLTCAVCGKEFSITMREKSFYKAQSRGEIRKCCSITCSSSIGGKSSKGVLRVYKKKKEKERYFCKNCGKEIGKTKFGVCVSCKHTSAEYCKMISETQKRLYLEGRHKGWMSREKRSYAEKFFIDVLKNNKIFDKCICEFPIRQKALGMEKNSVYQLDFYFPDKKLDLEIDGKQHAYNDRADMDNIRDFYLMKNGYIVYRISWKNINKKENAEYIKNEIDRFMIFYTNLPVG